MAQPNHSEAERTLWLERLVRLLGLPAKVGIAGLLVAAIIDVINRDIELATVIVALGPLFFYTAWLVAAPLVYMLIFGIRRWKFDKPFPEHGEVIVWMLFLASTFVFGFLLWLI